MWLRRFCVGAMIAAASFSLVGCTAVSPPEPAKSSASATDSGVASAASSSSDPAGANGKWFYSGYDDVRRAAVSSGLAFLEFSNEPGRRGKQANFGMWRGNFDCPGSCQVGISIDEGDVQERAATMRDPTSSLELAAPEQLWQSLLNARSLQVYYSADGVSDVVEFDLTGINAEKLPGF